MSSRSIICQTTWGASTQPTWTGTDTGKMITTCSQVRTEMPACLPVVPVRLNGKLLPPAVRGSWSGVAAAALKLLTPPKPCSSAACILVCVCARTRARVCACVHVSNSSVVCCCHLLRLLHTVVSPRAVIRYDLEFLGLCPCLVDVEIVDVKAGNQSIIVSAGEDYCKCKQVCEGRERCAPGLARAKPPGGTPHAPASGRAPCSMHAHAQHCDVLMVPLSPFLARSDGLA